jgi:lipid II:glycine glycyltransferase (peptidoglycan interpeptide bridge formation enzyme)
MPVHKYNKFSDIPGSGFFSEKVPIFATQAYADYLKEIKNHDTIWIADMENDTVTYMFPFTVIRKSIFKKGYCLTGVIYLGSKVNSGREREFLDEAILYIKKNKLCDWIQQGPNWALFNTAPSGSNAVRYGTYRIFLKDKNEDELFKLIDKRDRQDINKAIRSEVTVNKGVDFLDSSLEIINVTSKNADLQEVALPEVRKLIFHFNDHLKIYVSYKDGSAQSSTIFLGNKHCLYALFSGSKSGPFRGSNTYLFWEAIRDAKINNCNYFDFVGARLNPPPGSKFERMQRFKEHFGGEFIEGYLWKMNFSLLKYYLYQFLVRTILFLKGKKYKADIIDEELKRQ